MGWWVKCAFGEVDPRPLGALVAQPEFSKAGAFAAIFIVFAAPSPEQDIRRGLRATNTTNESGDR
jgi:hypothetical protein